MLGVIRLVNPWRGLVYVAQCQTQFGLLSARTEDFQKFSIYSVQGGKEFHPGRKFDREELAQWLLGEPLLPDQRSQLADEFGDIPAIAPNPGAWRWYVISGRGEERLKPQFRPTAAEMQRLAGFALSLQRGAFYPLLDLYEIWVCDKDSHEPIALVMTAVSLEDADFQVFSPRWRFNLSTCTPQAEVPLRELEAQVNQRINSSDSPLTFRWLHRLFRRNLDGSAVEYARRDPNDTSLPIEAIAQYPAGYLPEGLLAEPFESERRRWE